MKKVKTEASELDRLQKIIVGSLDDDKAENIVTMDLAGKAMFCDRMVIATGLAHIAASLPPWGAVALILVSAMAVTPFLNNAATVLVMAPIAAVFAHDLGYRPEAFLIATAVGAGCDFLTPIGHQCNTLVFGPGGYRFSDYARLGAPLSLLVVLFGTPLILWAWPL